MTASSPLKNKIIRMKKYIFFIALTILSKFLFAQDVRLQGQVVDNVGGIPGVNIVEKDVPGNGASTGADGKFVITLRGKSKVLVVKAIGFLTKEVNVGQSTSITITLETDIKGLDEVVVIGYGTTKKATLTGAVSSVSGADIRRNPSASLQNTLAGRLPGFSSQQTSGQPGSDGATFFIRGTGSYNGSNQPLIIVDDIEFTYAQFARLDANEIESVSILKDASTTAVYGIKGANGVVLVTTRRGVIGPPAITFRSEYALSQPTRLPKFLNSYESALLLNQARSNDGLVAAYTPEDIEHFRTGDDPYGHPDVDWKEVLFRDFSYQWRNNLDIGGGNDVVRYFASIGMINQNGLLNDFGKGEDVNNNFYYKRYNYRSNLDIKATKTLSVKVDLFGNIGERNNPVIPNINGIQNVFYFYNSFLTLAPFAYPIYNPDGSYGYSNAQPGRYNSPNLVQALSLGGYNRDFENNMNVNASAVQRLDFLTKGLSVRGSIAYGSTYTYSRGLSRGTFPSFIYNPINQTYTPRDPNVYRVGFYSLNYSPGTTTRTVNPQASLNYDRTIGSHHFSGLALYNYRSYFGRTDANNGSRVLNFIPVPNSGFSGRVSYDYKGKYLADFNLGYNKTEAFGDGNKYGFFPAGSIGYNISEEPFFKDNIKFIDRLKLRASYGLVGTDDIGNRLYSYLQVYNNSGSASFGTSHNSFGAIYEGSLANLDVTWEKVKKLNIGLEWSMFKGRFTGTFDVFNDDRYDILTTRGTVSNLFGQGLPPVNLGKTNNRGFEVEAAFNDRVGKDFTYRVGGNVSVAKNKIVFQDEAIPAFPYQRYTGNPIGTPLQYTFLGFYKDAADVANSAKPLNTPKPGDIKYADLNGDGIISDKDLSYFDYSNTPNTILGINLSANYKTLSLNVLFQGALNFNVAGIRESIQAFGSNLQAIHQQSWTPELGDNAKYPILSTAPNGISIPTAPSNFWNVRGDYVRLKSVELSYGLPQDWVNKVHLKGARIYVNGTNLITWTKLGSLYEYDPEISSNNTNTNYPPQRLYNLGLSVTF